MAACSIKPTVATDRIAQFLATQKFAVVGASADPSKIGNSVLLKYKQANKHVVPVNPKAPEIEGLVCVTSLSQLTEPSRYSVSVITPPAVSEGIIQDAINLGIKNVWLQPGAESAKAIQLAEQANINLIHGGPCVLRLSSL
ncbi:hypothetical protein CAOG_05109 [Capsaspora owczarzaki ATCC 30864]|uniref:CoA-binding domain-containing protein n=1 Tax=Capsaspora owczarzaki (strain ATCC 30864) TaxID=595528 RepID=A0A0D2WSM2_CAPO3|nr:hypothetical protein CAOG_05109 [Capsaspora owczarzaki ATCC 30864]KJE94473.1 hypothetical protein CAOG_005109 [Capsaspora owczarzaki ATCC 30864]|eukprot:XP_004346794.1 hypothetical protein CAOG_05109 [Capsaspora owczarzaki ATCC 30864]